MPFWVHRLEITQRSSRALPSRFYDTQQTCDASPIPPSESWCRAVHDEHREDASRTRRYSEFAFASKQLKTVLISEVVRTWAYGDPRWQKEISDPPDLPGYVMHTLFP